MKRSLLTLAFVALLLGCSATIEYHPFVGEPQILKGVGGACDYEEGIEIWLKGAPSQPFTIVGYIDGQYTDGIGEEAALKRLLAEKVKEVSGSGVFSRPDIDRYYGETGIYTVNPDFPSPVVVSIVRATFGLKVKVNNLTEGKLHIKTEGSPVATISYPETEVSYIFSAMYICSAFYEDAEGKTEFTNEYTERINVNITYENADGLEIPVKQEDYSFSRNEYTNLEVTVSGSAVGSGFEINVEQTKMEDDGREIEFTGGGDYKKN